MLQILASAACGMTAAWLAIMLTRLGFGLVRGKESPRDTDRIRLAILGTLALLVPGAIFGLIFVPTVASIDWFRENRDVSMFVFISFWLGPHAWYVVLNRPR